MKMKCEGCGEVADSIDGMLAHKCRPMTTENKAEAEKIAREIAEEKAEQLLAKIFHSECPIEYAHMETVQSLLDFREKDVRELVEALEPFALMAEIETAMTQNGSVPPAEHSTIIIKLAPCRKAAALVRKFKGGKEG